MVVAAFGARHHVVIHYVVRTYFQHWPPHVFGTLASACFFSIGLRMFFQLLPLLFFEHFAPIVLLGQNSIVFSAAL